MQRPVETFTVSQLATPLIFASAGLIILGIQPILLGALVAGNLVTADQVGLVAMAEIVCIGLGAGVAPAVLPLNRFRLVTLICSLLVATANLWSGRCGGFGDLLAARAAAGVGTGVLVWVASCVIVRYRQPDRLAGVFLMSQTLAQAAVAALLALWLIPTGGWPAGFDTLAVLVLLPGLLLWSVPASMHPLSEENSALPPFTGSVFLAGVVIVCQMAVVGGLWVFLELIAVAAGIPLQTVQLVISGTLVMQAFGGAVAAGVAPRMKAIPTLMAGGLIQAAMTLWIGYRLSGDTTTFIAICAVFGFVWMFVMPFHVQLALRVDESGRLAVLGAGLQLLGSALGPLVASGFVSEQDATPAAGVAAVFALLSVSALVLLKLVFRPVSAEAATESAPPLMGD